jgi:hypothetical protein
VPTDVHQIVHLTAQNLRRERIAANQDARKDLLHDGCGDLRRDRRLAFAPADQTGLRLDPHDHRLDLVAVDTAPAGLHHVARVPGALRGGFATEEIALRHLEREGFDLCYPSFHLMRPALGPPLDPLRPATLA